MLIDSLSLAVGSSIGLLFGLTLCAVFYQKGFRKGEEHGLNQIRFEVVPICRVSDFGALFWRSVKVQYGYQFQLFINGIPSLKSEETIIDTVERNEINQEQLLEFVSAAVQIAVATRIGSFRVVPREEAGRIADRVVSDPLIEPME